MKDVREIIDSRIAEKEKARNAYQLVTNLFIAASCVLFVTLFIVWSIRSFPEVDIPSSFYGNTILISLSSLSLHIGIKKLRLDDLSKAHKLVMLAGLLGLIFGGVQIMGWREMVLSGQISQNIVIPFTAIHFLHITVGIVLLYTAMRKIGNSELHSRNVAFLWQISRFWHFPGLVWLLFIFII